MSAEDTDQEASEQSSPEVNRRQVLTAAAAIAGAGAAGYGGYLVGDVEAASPSGTIGTSAEPLIRVYSDQVVFVNKSSDPSSPDNGTIWYNG